MDKTLRIQAIAFARRLGADREVVTRMREIEPTTMTLAQAQAALIERYVAKWGEGERAASARLVHKDQPTLGLALNRIAYIDIDNIDLDMAAQAGLALTADDVRVLRRGG